MERHNLDDRAAFQRLREHARSTNRTVVDVAAAVAEGPRAAARRRAISGPAGRGTHGQPNQGFGAVHPPERSTSVIGIVIAILVAALVYWLCLVLGLPSIVGIIAAILVLLGGVGTGRLRNAAAGAGSPPVAATARPTGRTRRARAVAPGPGARGARASSRTR